MSRKFKVGDRVAMKKEGIKLGFGVYGRKVPCYGTVVKVRSGPVLSLMVLRDGTKCAKDYHKCFWTRLKRTKK